jgi:site-specific DNA-methyltransferase (cytosine-N4-specific)
MAMVPYYRSKLGSIYLGDAIHVLEERIQPESIDLIMTSPPFGLVRKKD